VNFRKYFDHILEFLFTILGNLAAELQSKENLQNALLVLAAFVSGLAAVVYAKLFKLSEEVFLELIAGRRGVVFIITPLFFLIAWWIIFKFSKESSGSGIPQVLASNELNDDGADKSHIGRFLSFRVIFFKTISSIVCALGGGAIGREGPTIQISASIFYIFGDRVKKYFPDSKSHFWIISGASSGLAAAFNTPLGGIIYAIEELGAAHFSRIRTILLAAIITSGLVSLWLSGNYLYLGFPTIKIEGISIVPMAFLVGIISGLAGGMFSSLLFALARMRRAIQSTRTLATITFLCGISMASLIYMNTNSSGSGLDLLNDYLFHTKATDGFLVFSRFFGTIISYLSGSAGGIFSPALTIGGCIGGYIAKLFGSGNQNILILLGMIGFLTGVTKTPFTSFILVVEMTNKHSAIFPMMIAALIALLASNLVNKHSFYERLKEVYQHEITTARNKQLQSTLEVKQT
jgi:H+/Cl- antiporter ClcA